MELWMVTMVRGFVGSWLLGMIVWLLSLAMATWWWPWLRIRGVWLPEEEFLFEQRRRGRALVLHAGLVAL